MVFGQDVFALSVFAAPGGEVENPPVYTEICPGQGFWTNLPGQGSWDKIQSGSGNWTNIELNPSTIQRCD